MLTKLQALRVSLTSHVKKLEINPFSQAETSHSLNTTTLYTKRPHPLPQLSLSKVQGSFERISSTSVHIREINVSHCEINLQMAPISTQKTIYGAYR